MGGGACDHSAVDILGPADRDILRSGVKWDSGSQLLLLSSEEAETTTFDTRSADLQEL